MCFVNVVHLRGDRRLLSRLELKLIEITQYIKTVDVRRFCEVVRVKYQHRPRGHCGPNLMGCPERPYIIHALIEVRVGTYIGASGRSDLDTLSTLNTLSH